MTTSSSRSLIAAQLIALGTIRVFLTGAGFKDDEILVSPPRLEDR